MRLSKAIQQTMRFHGKNVAQCAREVGCSTTVFNHYAKASALAPRPEQLAKIILWLGKHNRKVVVTGISMGAPLARWHAGRRLARR